jgi:hypothetical protein
MSLKFRLLSIPFTLEAFVCNRKMSAIDANDVTPIGTQRRLFSLSGEAQMTWGLFIDALPPNPTRAMFLFLLTGSAIGST